MGQFGFFDADRRLAAITAKGDPLEMIARVVPFESFRAEIEAAVLTPVSEKKSTAGRKPIDVMVMFRMLGKQRNSREENDEVKAGKTPEAWEKNPAKNRQKDAEDKDARCRLRGCRAAGLARARSRSDRRAHAQNGFQVDCGVNFK
jgi:hypothetical protein